MPNEYGYALRRVAEDIERYSLDQSKTKEWNMKVCLSAADYLDSLEQTQTFPANLDGMKPTQTFPPTPDSKTYRTTSGTDPQYAPSGTSPVNHPSHYTQSSIECIDAIAAATVNLTGIEAVCTGNAIKYLWRWKLKGGQEDLEKAKRYIEMMIEQSAEVNP